MAELLWDSEGMDIDPDTYIARHSRCGTLLDLLVINNKDNGELEFKGKCQLCNMVLMTAHHDYDPIENRKAYFQGEF